MIRKFWRYTGYTLAGLGILHTVVFAIACFDALKEILKSGLFDSIGSDAARGLAWYGGLWFGITMILFGCFAQSWIKTTKQPLPCYIGWVLAALGLLGAVLQPVSGAILVLLLGLAVVFLRPAHAETNVK